MHTRKAKFVILIAVVLMLVGSLAAKDNPMGIAAQQTVNFTQPTIVGGTLLPAGDYKITHEMQGQTHIMIFKQIGGTAETKATCTLVPLTAKATHSEQQFKQNAKNERVLVAMTFAGDKATHMLAQ
jgi:hypothetical protein